MHHFTYKGGVLHAEDVNLETLADEVGTPFYCYSEATLRRHIGVFRKAFGGMDMLAAYSVKANSNLAVLKVMASEGAGADVVSEGELRRALAAGVPGEKIVFSGVGKTASEMAFALDVGICQFNVESENELGLLNRIAGEKDLRAPIAFRVNPDVSAGGHEKISTGKAEDKFGVAWSQVERVYAEAAAMPHIDIVGVDVHIGSQITDLAPFETAFTKLGGLIERLRTAGHRIDHVDLGGGLGVPYARDNAVPPPPDEYAARIRDIAKDWNARLIFEPGRMVAGNAGVLVARAVYVKEGEKTRFLILDAAMNDLIRPALYDAYHEITPVREPALGVDQTPYDVVGPVCETGDRFAKARSLPPVGEGDLVAFMTAGAYGAVLSSQYNTRPLAPEVLVRGDEHAVIRRRPSYEEMMALEATPAWLG